MKVRLEILLLLFLRISRILIETGLRLNLFLNLCHNIVSQFEKYSHAAWIPHTSLVLQYEHVPNQYKGGIPH